MSGQSRSGGVVESGKTPGRATATVFGALTVIGDLLMLQVVFLLLSFGIVTLFPAAFALQRVLPDVISQDRPRLLRRFWQEFRWLFRRFWATGLGLYFGGFALAFGLLFWAYSSGLPRILALALLIPLTGMILGLYLSALAVLALAGTEITPRELFRQANLFLLGHSLRVAGGLVVLLTWFALLVTVPTLIPIGSGLVPALVAYWLPRRRPEKSSADVSI